MSDLLAKITDVSKLEQLIQNRSDDGDRRQIDALEMFEGLTERVKGQDHVVTDLTSYVRRQWARVKRDRPIASLLLLGPTGTGKTELAKAITEYLYEKEENMLRFDCGQLKNPSDAMAQLIGSSGVWQGSEPGKLTQPVVNNPKRIIVFDEIEKGCKEFHDLFLTLMGEGHLTDQKTKRVADYTQSIVILTSNLEWEAVGKIQDEVSDADEMNNAVKQHLRDVKAFRPEIIGRFDRVYVFKKLEGMVLCEIAALKMVKNAAAFGLNLERVDAQLIYEAWTRSEKVKDFGIRELDRIINEIMDEPCIAAQEAGAKRIRLARDQQSGDLVVDAVE